MGVEIDDISNMTLINLRYLKAIEEGEFCRVPGDIYVRGYIREYARCLGIPFSDAIREYEIFLERERGREGDRPHALERRKFLRRLNLFFPHREKLA